MSSHSSHLLPLEHDTSLTSYIMPGCLLAATSYFLIPQISQKVGSVTQQVWNEFSLHKQRMREWIHVYAPESIQKWEDISESAFQTAGKVAAKGFICFHEFLDVLNEGGTKDPSISIEKSRERLGQHHLPFANCIDFLAEEAAQAYVRNGEKIKHLICEAIQGYPFDQMDELEELIEESVNPLKAAQETFFDAIAYLTDGFLSLSTELIGQTIKANILHITANLADAAYEEGYSFADHQRNPFGRLLSVIGNCFAKYEQRLEAIERLTLDEQAEAYPLLFRELSSDLLATCFPKGAQDLQLFHPIIPVKLIKAWVWEKINEELPGWLENFYRETRALDKEKADWKEQFDDKSDGVKAEQCLTLPSYLYQHVVRDNHAQLCDAFIPTLIAYLKEHDFCMKDVEGLSTFLTKYAKEFLLTDDPVLHKMGKYLERYVMEHLLFNLSQFVPDDAEIPMFHYVLKQWITGDLFRVFSAFLTGKEVTTADKERAVDQGLAPFGLNREDRFPLPPSLKKQIWPTVRDLLKETIPSALFDLIPACVAMREKTTYQREFNEALKDESLTQTMSQVTKTVTQAVFASLQNSSSIAEKINALFSVPVLSDEQWENFLEDNHTLSLLTGFSHQCLEAFVLQIGKDLYASYQKQALAVRDTHALVGLSHLFGEEGEEKEEAIRDELPFAAWVVREMRQACESLSTEYLSPHTVKALQQAIHLKNCLREATDIAQIKKEQEELDALWPTIQPLFASLLLHALNIFGYKSASHLPVPKEFQQIIWTLLAEKVPYLLFEQIGDTLLPLIEKKRLQEEIDQLPEGRLINKECQALAQDIVNHLPEWLDGQLDALPERLQTISPDIILSEEASFYLVNTLSAIVKKEDPAYQPIWQWLESYLEGMFLKIAFQMATVNQANFQALWLLMQLQELGENDREEAKERVTHCVDQLLIDLGIEAPRDLFGIPQSLQEKMLHSIKASIAQALFEIYTVYQKIDRYTGYPNAREALLSTADAVRALTHYVLDRMTDKFSERIEGKVAGAMHLSQALNNWLKNLASQHYQSASLLQPMIEKEVLTPTLVNLFDRLEDPSTQPHKEHLIEWIEPILTDQAIKHLSRLLEKEQEGGASFDQALLMAFLPVLTAHLQHLNQASPVEGEKDWQRQNSFYQEQAAYIFQLIFPQGREGIAHLLPALDISQEKFEDIQEAVETLIASQLPSAIEALFDKEIIVILLTSLFESAIDNLNRPIEFSSSKSKLTEEEQEQQEKINAQVGKFVVEAAQCLDVPIELLQKFPSGIKEGIEKGMYASIGAVLRKQFDGQFFEKILPLALSNIAKQRYIKLTPVEKLEKKQQEEQKLNALERKFAETSISYLFRYLGSRLAHATDIFSDPVTQSLRWITLSLCSFVFVTLLGSLLRLLGLEHLLVNALYALIHHRSQKVQQIFSKPELHEEFVVDGVEAFERVLIEKGAE